MEDVRENFRREVIPLKRVYSEEEWTDIFKMYDNDNDGKIPIDEFIRELEDANNMNKTLTHKLVEALKEADADGDNIITVKEFQNLVKNSIRGRSKYGRFVIEYVRKTVPPRRKLILHRPFELVDVGISTDGPDYYDTAGEYEDEYSCWPPPLAMICMSLIEKWYRVVFVYILGVLADSLATSIFDQTVFLAGASGGVYALMAAHLATLILVTTFLSDYLTEGDKHLDGPISKVLIYNPHRRIEAWRFLSYMFVHGGIMHILVNVAMQILIGIPLEMVQKWYRVVFVYILGVLAGSLATSIFDPTVFLAGASGGVYALMAAHLATLILNWAEMEYGVVILIIICVVAIYDTGSAIYSRYYLEQINRIGYAAHIAGAIAGLLVGIYVFRNLEQKSWEKKLCWAALVLFSLLTGSAIIIHLAYPSHFPEQSSSL